MVHGQTALASRLGGARLPYIADAKKAHKVIWSINIAYSTIRPHGENFRKKRFVFVHDCRKNVKMCLVGVTVLNCIIVYWDVWTSVSRQSSRLDFMEGTALDALNKILGIKVGPPHPLSHRPTSPVLHGPTHQTCVTWTHTPAICYMDSHTSPVLHGPTHQPCVTWTHTPTSHVLHGPIHPPAIYYIDSPTNQPRVTLLINQIRTKLKSQEWGLPLYIWAYWGNPASLNHWQASTASTSGKNKSQQVQTKAILVLPISLRGLQFPCKSGYLVLLVT